MPATKLIPAGEVVKGQILLFGPRCPEWKVHGVHFVGKKTVRISARFKDRSSFVWSIFGFRRKTLLRVKEGSDANR